MGTKTLIRMIDEHNDRLADMQTAYRNYYDCNIMAYVAYREALEKCRKCALRSSSTVSDLLSSRKSMQNISRQYGASRFSTLVGMHFRDWGGACHSDIERWFRPVSARTYDARNMIQPAGAGRWHVAVEPLNDSECVANVANRVMRFHGAMVSVVDATKARVITVYGFFDNIDPRASRYVSSAWNDQAAHRDVLSLGQLMSFDRDNAREWVARYKAELQTLKQLTTTEVVNVFNKGDSLIDVVYSFLMEDTFYTRSTIQALCLLLQNKDTHAYHTLMRTIPDSLLPRLRCITSNDENCLTDTLYLDYETRIRMLDCSNEIKQLAHKRLNEIRVKPFDSSFKAKQYLDTLLSIPFGRTHTSQAVRLCQENSALFSELAAMCGLAVQKRYTHIDVVREYPVEVQKYHAKLARLIRERLAKNKRAALTNTAVVLNALCGECRVPHTISYAGVRKSDLVDNVGACFEFLAGHAPENIQRVFDVCDAELPSSHNATQIIAANIRSNVQAIDGIVQQFDQIMDDAIYGHKRAKKSLQRIFAQVLNGEPRGYCIGFEGAPGLGKTSLAREGIAKLFADERGNPRPFAFIAVGGASSASFFDGHSYTYVESTCGKIVELLIQHKCMNPIIFIDEIDKLSQTEQGKELTGVITHLIDFTQNMEFQDKYFTGVPFNLSNVLFIVSYNDAAAIDRVILDRIHRVAFDPLSSAEKHVIAKQYIMPKILRSMGMVGRIVIPDETYSLIIDRYTREAGVRKLSEHLHEVVGNITASQIRAPSASDVHVVSPDDVGRMFHDKPTNSVELPTDAPSVGVSNALWADSCSCGGVMRIEAQTFPSDKPYDLRLTGTQGGVMQESMHVAKTVAWNALLDAEARPSPGIHTPFVGIHVHCPMTAQPKDGPSAGLAIALAIYSLLANRPLRANVCITGEITLKGRVDRVGGIKQKFIGAIEAGSRCIIYPKDNQPDVDSFVAEHPDASNVDYVPVDHIKEAIEVLH